MTFHTVCLVNYENLPYLLLDNRYQIPCVNLNMFTRKSFFQARLHENLKPSGQFDTFFKVLIRPDHSSSANSTQMNEPGCKKIAISQLLQLSCRVNFEGGTANAVFYHMIELSFSWMYCFSSKLPRNYPEEIGFQHFSKLVALNYGFRGHMQNYVLFCFRGKGIL